MSVDILNHYIFWKHTSYCNEIKFSVNFTFLDIDYDCKLVFHTSLGYLNRYINISI